MIVHQGVYLPDGEKHLVDWMNKAGEIVDGKGSYQIAKLRKALSHCTQFRTAVDVGAHVGLWSMQLAKKFIALDAFEPVESHRECWIKNLADQMHGYGDKVDHVCGMLLHKCALGERDGLVSINTAPTSSGDSWVDGAGDIPMKRLDSFKLADVDFVKIDAEGFELFVLRGAEETLKRCKPVVIVEQKPGRAQKFGLPETGAVAYLQGLGYRLAEEISGDFIMVPSSTPTQRT